MTTPQELAVASYNIHKGVGTDRRRDLARTAAVLAEIGGDIIALQEADTRFGTRRGLLDLDSIRHDLGLIPVPLESSGPAHGWHGNVLLVRDALVHDVHQLDLPGLEPRGAMVTDLMIGNHPLRVVNAHLGLLARARTLQARALLQKLTLLPERPTLLMGDLNEWRSTSKAMQTLGEHFDIATPQPSFPSRYPLLALDRMMLSPHGALRDVKAHNSPLARQASDHLPITGKLLLGSSAAGQTS